LQTFGEDYPTPDGTCVRDCIHVGDLVAAHLLALDAAEPGRHKVYNLGNGNGFPSKTHRGHRSGGHRRCGAGGVRTAPTRDPSGLVASSARASAELGWMPAKPDLHTSWKTPSVLRLRFVDYV